MSFDDQSPYQSPQPDYPMKTPQMAGASSKKPAALIGISVVALIFGIIGTFNGCCGVVAPLFQDSLVGFMDSVAEQGGEEAEMQRDAMKAAFDASSSLMIPVIASKFFGLLVSCALIVGGIAGLRGAPVGRTLLAGSLLLCVPSRIIDVIVTSIVTVRTNAAQRLVYEEAGMDQQLQMMEAMQPFTLGLGIVISLAMVILYTVLGLYILRSKTIKAYLERG